MFANKDLNQRYKKVLKATVEYYIDTAEPVGSKAIAKKRGIKISSATIRNVMGQLESAGLLYQPHTSSGRVPSDFGYRMYVDSLLTPDHKIGKELEQSLLQKLSREKASIEAFIQQVTQILAAFSGYIAIISFPNSSSHILRHLQLIPAASGQIMLIVVTDSYQTESILMESPLFLAEKDSQNEETKTRELQKFSNFLNFHLKGKSLADIETIQWEQLNSFGRQKPQEDSTLWHQEMVQYEVFFQDLLNKLVSNLKTSTLTPLAIKGIAKMLRQPEFSQLQQIRTLLSLLEEDQAQLSPLLFELPDSNLGSKKVKIVIGSENNVESMQSCTLVSANYFCGQNRLGSVGVIGPTRMLYENTISLVESTTNYLSETFSYSAC